MFKTRELVFWCEFLPERQPPHPCYHCSEIGSQEVAEAPSTVRSVPEGKTKVQLSFLPGLLPTQAPEFDSQSAEPVEGMQA